MTLSLTLALLSLASAPACIDVAAGGEAAVPTEEAAIAAARTAWKSAFVPAEIDAREPYHAELVNGTWHVAGTLPKGWRGGTPEALICAIDGKVLKVFHSR
jgi:hypothetical protein